MSSLSLQPSIVPRKLLVDGDPSKLVFAKELGKLVVAIDQTMLIPDASPRRPARRVVRPGIQFLGPDPCDASSDRKQVELLGQAGSRITSLLSWTPTNGTKRLQMIVVGLYMDGPDTANCDGRIIYLTARKNGRQNCDLEIVTNHTIKIVGSPIYSLAQYGLSSLVVCAGTGLFLQSLDISTGTWVRGASYTLPSPAVSLHVSGQLIYATTARHSLKIFEVEDGELTLRAKETQTRDAMREATQFVGNDEGGMLAISTNKGGRVRGLSRQPDGEFMCLFEARLPLIVNCLRESYTGDSIHQAGKKYYGSTQDGGLYQFTILSRQEWEFLDFIAKIARKTPVTRPSVKRKSSGLQRRERKKVRPTEMHIKGDQIFDIVRKGPNELRRLIEEASPSSLPGQESRSPDQRVRQLSALGEPLFGTTEDPVLAAARWMQKLVSDTSEGRLCSMRMQ
jgi:CPSF A subunit region